jgi:NAD+ diphosphatase
MRARAANHDRLRGNTMAHMAVERFRRTYPPIERREGYALWFLFRGEDLLVAPDGTLLFEGVMPPFGATEATAIALGDLDAVQVFAAALPDDAPLPPEFEALHLRAILGRVDAAMAELAGYAASIVRWQRESHFCPVCGATTALVDGSWGRACTSCDHSRYPPVSPAIIVLVHDDDGRALLATKPGWGKRFSLVAGFVEPGETLEGCVVREVREEVGVDVDRVRYISSQPWPFPHQMMIGFVAHYTGGEIAIDAAELADARWFTRDELPELPPPFTISRQLINLWISGEVG